MKLLGLDSTPAPLATNATFLAVCTCAQVQSGQYSQLALESALVEPLNDLLNVEQLEKLLADCRRTYTW